MESSKDSGFIMPSSGSGESNEMSKVGGGDNDLVREHLVNTAVKFLQNPRVRPTSLAQKQLFLRTKGLTEPEVELACARAGAPITDDDENNNKFGSKALAPSDPRTIYASSTRTSLLLKAMDVANMIALFSIGSYSLYSLWKNYIAPRIYGTRSRLEQNYERLLESITSLNQNVVELRELMRESQLQSGARVQQSLELQDVRREIASIKTLLLGRSQFPSPSSSQIGIPSWQMVEAGDNSNENSDESSSRSKRPVKKDKGERSSNSRSKESSLLQAINPTSDRCEEDSEGNTQPQSPSMRKHPSLDSNNGFTSGSSCEVVFMQGKNDSSDPDHSE